MINHVWSVLSRESRVDAETHNLSIFDIYEKLAIDATPDANFDAEKTSRYALPIPHEITTTLYRESTKDMEKASLRVRPISPAGEVLGEHVQDVRFAPGINRFRTRIKSPTLVCTTSGTYTYEIGLKTAQDPDYKVVAKLPLDINLALHEE